MISKLGERLPWAAVYIAGCSAFLGAAACGNDAKSSSPGSADGGHAPAGTAGSAATSGGSSPAGSGNQTSGGSSPSSGGSSSASDGGKPGVGSSGGTSASGGMSASSGGMSSATAGSAGSAGSAPSGGTPPSCATSGAGRTNCGPNMDESCCTSLPVAGGMYSRTYTNSGSGAMGKADPATLSTFRLDKYETTVARFREYVKYLESGSPPAAGSGKHTHLNEGKGLADSGKSGSFEAGWDASWNSKIPSGSGATAKWKANLTSSSGTAGCKVYGTWTDDPGKNELLPITCTSWYESYAFCIWDGGFLPSEAEWKYAAAGGDEQREYPWGTTDPGTMNEYAIYDCCYPSGKCSATSGSDTCTGLVNVAPVGYAKKGVGKYGQFDLIGSVWEWNLDKFANYVSPCTDCAYLTGSTTNRVLPGAGFHSGASLGNTIMYSYNRTSVSYNADTYRGDYAVGLRCARTP